MADHLLSFTVLVVGTELAQEGGMGIDCMEAHYTGSIQVLVLGKDLLASCLYWQLSDWNLISRCIDLFLVFVSCWFVFQCMRNSVRITFNAMNFILVMSFLVSVAAFVFLVARF